MDKLLNRTTFDFSCAKPLIKLTCLNGNRLGSGEWCLTAGVEACGHKATYLFEQTAVGDWQWVMNNVDGQIK